MSKIQRALVSVSDKTGLVDFCRELQKLGVEIISTANSRKNILEHKQSNATPLVAPARITFDHDMAVVLGGKDRWLAALAARQPVDRPFTVALSGGRITQKFFASVVEQNQSRKTSFANVHFFWADERCVPPSHPDSNFKPWL